MEEDEPPNLEIHPHDAKDIDKRILEWRGRLNLSELPPIPGR